ncbi:MAG TPA: lipopolysaccharide biosynthesis protein [Candidatus Eisenbacteria bacterium]|nr:lipopolysaccharide biosynthesis protein [Candidatus Eisenbacteria bacterium]
MDLKRQAVTSTAWYAGTRLVTQVITWSVTLVLARLLMPADYGLFAMALAVIAFLELFQEFGLGVAIIQRQNMSREQLNAIFWTVTGSSAILAAVAIAGAGVAARFYHEPRLEPIVRVLGLTFLLNALGLVPFNLLTKEIDFRRRSLAEGVAAVSAAAVSLALAAGGKGVWALVVGNLTRTLIFNVGAAFACRWWPGLRSSFQEMGEIFKFGLRVAGTGAVNSLSTAVNTSIVGRQLGGADLGLYTMADSLGRSNPLHKISTSVVTQLALAVFSKLQRDDAELRRYFLKISRYLALMSLPLQIGMALTAHDLVEILLSAKWLPIVPVLQAFCVGGILSIMPLPSFPLLTARGQVTPVFRYTVGFAIVMAVVTYAGCLFGLQGVAVAWLIAFPLLRLIPLQLSLREAGIRAAEYLKTIAAPVQATLVMAALVAFVVHVAMAGQVPGVRLAVSVATGAVAYLGTLLLIDRSLGAELREILRLLRPGAGRGEPA